MSQRRTVSVVAAAALLLGCAPLSLLFTGLFEWMVPATLTVMFVVGAAVGVRSIGGNVLLQTLAMCASLLFFCTWMFRSGGEYAGIVPSADTFAHFSALSVSAGEQIRTAEIPVTATDGILFLLVTGIGTLAIIAELFTATLRSPSLVGILLLALYLVPVALYPSSTPWVLFLPGAAGYLWLLMTDNINRVRAYGRRFSGDARGVRSLDPSPLAGRGRWIIVVALSAAVIFPALTPGATNGLFNTFAESVGPSLNGGGNHPGSGGDSRVNPVAELQGALDTTETEELALVDTDEPDPGYLKMWSATELTEDGFGAVVSIPDAAVPAAGDVAADTTPTEDVPYEEYQATFTALGLNDQALPLYDGVRNIDVEGDWYWDPDTETVTSEDSDTRDLQFSYTYRSYEYTPDLLRQAPEANRSGAPYRQYTDHPTEPRVTDEVEQLVDAEDTQYDQVMAIHDHFSRDNGFSYELRTEEGWTSSAIVNFLDEKRGYCQQYAAAMGWMLREANIPARVAIGMTRGNSTDEGHRLTNFNFHAWVEVHFEGIGWVPFDPTPSTNVRTAVDTEWAPDPDQPDDNSGTGTDDPGDDPGGDDGQGSSDGADGSDDFEQGHEASAIVRPGQQPPAIWPYAAAAGALAVTLFLLPAFARATRRRRLLAQPASPPDLAVHSAWQEFNDTLTDLGYSRDPSQTPRGLERQLTREVGADSHAAAGIRHLAAAEAAARYSRQAPDEVTPARAFHAAWAGLQAARSRRTQLRARLFPRSTLTRWRRTWTKARAAVAAAPSTAAVALLRAVKRLRPRRHAARA